MAAKKSSPSSVNNQSTAQSLPSTASPPTSSCTSPCATIFTEYQLMKEFVLFQKQELLHVYVSPSHRSPFCWFAVMFIHQGLYRGKILRFTIRIGHTYPNCDIPDVVFDPIPCHPLIDQATGEFIGLRAKFPNWSSTTNYLYELILFVKCSFEFSSIDQLKQIYCFNDNAAAGTSLTTTDAQLKQQIEEKMFDFNDQCIRMKHSDLNFINLNDEYLQNDDNSRQIIDRLRQKLLTEKFPSSLTSINAFNDYLNGQNSSNNNGTNPMMMSSDINYQSSFGSNRMANTGVNGNNNRTTSISGLSWTKKIVYN